MITITHGVVEAWRGSTPECLTCEPAKSWVLVQSTCSLERTCQLHPDRCEIASGHASATLTSCTPRSARRNIRTKASDRGIDFEQIRQVHLDMVRKVLVQRSSCAPAVDYITRHATSADRCSIPALVPNALPALEQQPMTCSRYDQRIHKFGARVIVLSRCMVSKEEPD